MTGTSAVRVTAALAAALLATGCRDSQTDAEVTTRSAGGDVATSMSGDSADRRGLALVRVVNAVAGADRVVVRADPTHVLATAEYAAVTPYQPIDRNWVTFEVGAADSGAFEPLATNRELLTDGHRYTIVVMRDSADGWETRVLRDEIALDSARAQLRVIHAARGIGEVDVIARGGDTIFDGVNFTSEAGYMSLAPWSGTLEIRSADGNRLLHVITGVRLDSGHAYTIVLLRNREGKLATYRFEDSEAK